MRDLWEDVGLGRRSGLADRDGVVTHFVTSLDRGELDAKAAAAGAVRTVVGLGGGQALDVAKYFAWKTGATLFQLPTALTVDAAWGHRAAVREQGVVRYVGYAVPAAVYVDLDVVLAAPPALNLSGVGDVLCYHTAHADWALAERLGEAGRWPWDAVAAAQARAVLERLLAQIEEVAALSDRGVAALVRALSYGGAAYHAHGWNPRPVEGFDHVFFTALEHRTGVHFIHGYPVLLGVWLGSRLQGNRAEWVLRTVVRLGVDIRPEALKVTWEDVRDTLLSLAAFAAEQRLIFTVANAVPITEEWAEAARAALYAAYDQS